MGPVRRQIAAWALLVSGAVGQVASGTATVKNIAVTQDGANVRVEVTLSSPVQPSIETAVNPDRILLDLPDTITQRNMERAVHASGVRRVRVGQHSATPAVTRVVIDLEQARSYTTKAEGSRIILTVGPAVNAEQVRSRVPASPVSLGVRGIFRRKADTPQVTDSTSAGENSNLAGGTANRDSNEVPMAGDVASKESTSSSTSSQAQISADSKTRYNTVVTGGFPSTGNNTPGASAGAKVRSTPFDEKASELGPASMRAMEAESNEKSSGAGTDAAARAPGAGSEGKGVVLVRSDDPSLHTVFRVKYVAEGVAYLEGGSAQGLAEGMKLLVKDTNLPARQGESVNAEDPAVVAELEVSGVAETSSVTDIHSPKRPVVAGDLAYLSNGDAEALVAQRALSATRQYPAVISFSEGDTLDEEAREEVPRPPLPSVNRARGRIGLDYVTTMSQGTSSMTTSNLGFSFRGDMTRIGGTYWNLSGYYRGRFTSQSPASQQTIQDLINHTYHLSMTYDNPNSSLVAGFGRLYLPWAASLDTIDGGYFGKRLSKGATVGIFGGSTPDPSSWNYSPDRVIGGAFINFDGGSYQGWHYSSTSGAGISMVSWKLDRPFVFLEDTVSYSRRFAVYEAAQFDSPAGNAETPAPGPGLGRSFFTMRVQVHPRVELDFNHNYFRDVPTYDPTLIGTGLLDKFLFQGFSAGVRVEVLKQVFVSTTLGRSNRTGDASAALNQMYGITFNRLPLWQLRAGANYARFSSSFGSGSYTSFMLSRQISEALRLEFLAGQQSFNSPATTNDRSRFLTTTWETLVGQHYYLQGNFTINRGQLNYQQWMFSIGYRFDSKTKAHE